MSEEIKVGDRFEWTGDGNHDTWTIVAKHDEHVDMLNSTGKPGNNSSFYPLRHFSDATIWRRLPREVADKPAPEVKEESTSLAPYMIPAARNEIADKLLRLHEEMREAAYAQAGIPQANVYRREYLGRWSDEPEPTPPAKALPFRYMPAADDNGNSPYRCPDSAKHDGTQCLTCEGIIAKLMQSGDKDMTLTREAARKVTRPAYEPACGAFVGRVLTPVRR